MEIIKRGEYKQENVIITCHNCKSELKIELMDLHRNSYSIYIFCAVCGDPNDITEDQCDIIRNTKE